MTKTLPRLTQQLYYNDKDELCLLKPDLQGRPSGMVMQNGMILFLKGMMLEYRDGIFYGMLFRFMNHSPYPTSTGITFTEKEMIDILQEEY